MIDGIVNVYKEKGFTSHDVVAVLRGVFRQRKIGHTGTLDPDATGVLPVCLGRATKVCELLTDHDKTYETVLLLGQSTDTQDVSGEVLAQASGEQIHALTEVQVREVIESFLGDQLQIPPMYSAKKVNGKKLVDLAREGIVIERKPSAITVSEIEILSMELPRVRMRITCSKGTYIRTLCNDMGEKLGCGGCMEELIRVRVGCFSIEDAITLDAIKQLVSQGELPAITAIDEIFSAYEKVSVPESLNKQLYNGAPVPGGKTIPAEKGTTYRVYDQDDRFIGLYTGDGRTLRLKKMFFNINEM